MLKSIYSFCFLSVLSLNFYAQHKSIEFEHGTFSEIKEKAIKENKLIFIDAFTTWCGPCKQMSKNVFTNDTVADYYNKNFVNAKIDMEKGEGIEIAKQYEVRCYPNLLFIDGKGNLIHRVAGSMTPKEFVDLGSTASNPEVNFSFYVKNYDANKKNATFLKQYIEAKENTCLDNEDLVKDYFSLQKENELLNAENWEMIYTHLNNMDSREYNYLVSHKVKYENTYNADLVNEKINSIHRNTLYSIINQKEFNEKYYIEIKEKISGLNFKDSKLVFFESDLKLARKTNNWKLFQSLAVGHVDEFYMDNADMLNSIAWDFYEKIDNKEALAKAESWSKKACEIESNYANLDTYAAVLYKLGKKQLALETANKAIDAAKKDKLTTADYQGTTDLLKKIKELK